MRCLLLLVLVGSLARAESPPATHQVKLNGHTFTLPQGFTIELAAKAPLVDRPVAAAFDAKGRLYVTDSSGSNEPPVNQLKNPTHRIVRLEDTDGDGKFDKSVVFADKVMFPQGILCCGDSVYLGAPPHIWKLTDTDDDGKADKREVWFDGKTLTGCANDLHGPYLGVDGWIYWTKGAFAEQTYTLPNGKPFTTRAAHIFRAKPDGSQVEPVMTGGMDNPVDVVFLPNGNRFFTTTFLQRPGGGNRDGIIHAIYGGIYGKDHDVIYTKDHKWTAPHLMPVMTHLGPAAPSGLHRYNSNAFGNEYTDNLFATQFNMRKVSRHILKQSGSTYTTQDSDFVVSDNQDFHPTDVIEDDDGSLLIVDTGGWYKLCCPSSQLVKEDVLGAIYRVRKVGAKRSYESPSSREWRHRFATAAQMYTTTDRKALRETLVQIDKAAISDSEKTIVQQFSIHQLGLLRDPQATSVLVPLLKSDNAITRRMTAEALGRIGDSAAVPALLQALERSDIDRPLEHAYIYALIEIGANDETAKGLQSTNPRVRQASLIALDQMGKLTAKQLAPFLTKLDETSLWVASHHPEWSKELANEWKAALKVLLQGKADELTLNALTSIVRSEIGQQLCVEEIQTRDGESLRLLLQAMSRAGLKKPPEAWYQALEVPLRNIAYPDRVRFALEGLRGLPVPKHYPECLSTLLGQYAGDSKLAADLRLSALTLIPGTLDETQLALVLASIDREQPAPLRGLAADVLSKSSLPKAQVEQVLKQLTKVGPLELDRILTVFAQTRDDGLGKQLIATLSMPELRSRIRSEIIKERIKHFGPPVQREAEKLYAALNADYDKQRARLEELSKTLPTGDVRRGQAIFNSTKTSCIACHTIGYVGGKIGPDLTRIGNIRSERDFLEAILFPSASFVRSYEPVSVMLKDGRRFNGIAKKDAADEMILTLAADKEIRIPREDIEEVTPSKVSIMPDGLDRQLTQQELADLITFLKGCR
jgi:putative membrane-bound dehydrogenase-like protein